ncbi:MAG: Smr/MutS family protein [Thiobacillaceae bacterium]|nr:Smr/MutS family protein [Thiobacillaceae bacterium]MCX7673794.1 Smr/MutS family protein [Thiobacillaceae bacterium]MDW8323552.1 Smr/MutS family protein [Burkholderiales bacterium]
MSAPRQRRPSASPTAEDIALFRAAMADVEPLTPHGRYLHDLPPPPPIPRSRLKDERAAVLESLTDPVRWDESLETGDEASYVRPGLPRVILRRLRAQWVAQAELDLHGLNRLEAKHELADFLLQCRRRGIRCVRIIHGKGRGSVNREPVLKLHVRHWLTQREEVLAFVQARPADGGGGAVMVLLRGD